MRFITNVNRPGLSSQLSWPPVFCLIPLACCPEESWCIFFLWPRFLISGTGMAALYLPDYPEHPPQILLNLNPSHRAHRWLREVSEKHISSLGRQAGQLLDQWHCSCACCHYTSLKGRIWGRRCKVTIVAVSSKRDRCACAVLRNHPWKQVMSKWPSSSSAFLTSMISDSVSDSLMCPGQ